jgi:hypothetical protein
MDKQELRVKALELSLQTFSLYPAENRAATFDEDQREGKIVSKAAVDIAERYYTFLTTIVEAVSP